MKKEEFFQEYEILGMCKNSLKLAKRETNEIIYISRNAFNFICAGKVEQIRIKYIPQMRSTWIEVNLWTSI